MGGKDDEDPCANKDRRSKLKIEHGEEEDLRLEGSRTFLIMQSGDETTSKESAHVAAMRVLSAGLAVDAASSSDTRIELPAPNGSHTPLQMSPTQRAPGPRGDILRTEHDRDLLGRSGCASPPGFQVHRRRCEWDRKAIAEAPSHRLA